MSPVPRAGGAFPNPVLQLTYGKVGAFPGAHPERGELKIHIKGRPEPELQPVLVWVPLGRVEGLIQWIPVQLALLGGKYPLQWGQEPPVSPSSACAPALGRKALPENYFSWGKIENIYNGFFLYISLFRIIWKNIWASGQYELVSFLYPVFWWKTFWF